MRNEFEGECGDLLKSLFPIAERVDDSHTNRNGGFQVRQKPWDYYGCTGTGRMWAAEVKRVRSATFPLRNFADHQHVALNALDKAGGLAWVFINWRNPEVERMCGVAVWVPYVYFHGLCCETERVRAHLKPSDFDSMWRLARTSGGWQLPEEHLMRTYL